MVSAAQPIVFDNILAVPHDASVKWERFRSGIQIVRLYNVPDGPAAAFLRYAPGASLERHFHSGYEHIFVLQGSQIDDSGEHGPGTLLIHPPGTTHAIHTISGCVVLAIWEKPVRFGEEPDDDNSL